MDGVEPPWLTRHPRRSYIVQAVLSCPPWVNRQWLRALADKAREKSEFTGVEHVLDHIVPLNHPYVCGLTVPWNLRIVPRITNGVKGNSWGDGQNEMFEGPEQLRLFQ
jgi:hypothetical protein